MTFHSLKQHAVFLAIVVAVLAIYGVLVYHHYSKSDMVAQVAPSPSPSSNVFDFNAPNAVMTVDSSGNVGVSGSAYEAGSSVYGPTSATVNGDLTVTNSTWNGSGSTSSSEEHAPNCHDALMTTLMPVMVGKTLIEEPQITHHKVCD